MSFQTGFAVLSLAMMASSPPPTEMMVPKMMKPPKTMMRPWMVSVMTTAWKPPTEV